MTTATLPRTYGQRGGEFPLIDGHLTTSRRRTGTEVHLTSITVEDGVIVGIANTTLCNHRSGSNVSLVSGTPTCERCLTTLALLRALKEDAMKITKSAKRGQCEKHPTMGGIEVRLIRSLSRKAVRGFRIVACDECRARMTREGYDVVQA